MTVRILLIVIGAAFILVGCDNTLGPDATPNTGNSQDQNALPTRTFSGQITIDKLPPHYGLTVSLAFFPVDGPDSVPPYDGDPPADAVTDCPELYDNVDLDTERVESTRSIPFSIEHSAGHYYIQLRTLLYRKQDGKVFAQAEQFFFGRRPLELLADIPAATLPVEWPSVPLDELGRYGTVKPQKGQ